VLLQAATVSEPLIGVFFTVLDVSANAHSKPSPINFAESREPADKMSSSSSYSFDSGASTPISPIEGRTSEGE
jgi:hypothetical protein